MLASRARASAHPPEPASRTAPRRGHRGCSPASSRSSATVVAVEQLSDAARLTIRGSVVKPEDAEHGASIAVNGVCLTVVDHDSDWFTADVMAETLRPVQPWSAAGGVPGQPRATRAVVRPARRPPGAGARRRRGADLVAREPGDHWEVVRVELPAELARYVVEKGSVTVDGVSLTVWGGSPRTGVDASWFEVSLIPTALELTALGREEPGDPGELKGRRGREVRRTTADTAGVSAGVGAGGGDAVMTQVRLEAGSRTPWPRCRRPAVVVVDDEDRENEGDLIFAASWPPPSCWGSSSGTPPASSASR